MLGIPGYRLKELAQQADRLPNQRTPATIAEFLERTGVDLSLAREYYRKLGGDAGAREVNNVSTNFTALNARTLDQLEAHAAWQTHAAYAVYGF